MAKPGSTSHRTATRTGAVARGAAALVAALCLVPMLAGCRAVDNAQVDVLERELRQQENYIYELEDYVMEYSEKLRDCRSCQTDKVAPNTTTTTRRAARGLPEPTLADDRPTTASQSPAAGVAPRSGAPVMPPVEDAFDAPPPASDELTPGVTTPQVPPVDPAEIEAPDLEIGPTGKLNWKGAAPIATAPPGDEAPPYMPDPADYQLDAEAPMPSYAERADGADSESIDVVQAPELFAATEAVNQSAPEAPVTEGEPQEPSAIEPPLPPPVDPARLTSERLEIRRIVGQPASDGEPGSLLVVVEALNATSEPVDADGAVSLMVMAGESEDALRRVDRWDFTSEETQAAWQSSPLGDGLHLQLPLEKAELPQGRLELWARMVTTDGRKLLTKLPFTVQELPSLDEAMKGAASTSLAAVPSPEHGQDETEGVGAGDTTGASAEESAAAPTSQWKTAAQPVDGGARSGVAISGATTHAGGWTRSTAAVPSVARASHGEPRWQHGSADGSTSDGGNTWAPFR